MRLSLRSTCPNGLMSSGNVTELKIEVLLATCVSEWFLDKRLSLPQGSCLLRAGPPLSPRGERRVVRTCCPATSTGLYKEKVKLGVNIICCTHERPVRIRDGPARLGADGRWLHVGEKSTIREHLMCSDV